MRYARELGIGALASAALCSHQRCDAQFWEETVIPPPASITSGGQFGWSVSLMNDTLLAGAPLNSDPSPQCGGAYLFARDNGGPDAWDQVLELTTDAPLSPFARFGFKVLLQNDRAYVSAPFDVVNQTPRGAIYIFERNAGGAGQWDQVQRVVAQEGPGGMRFGWNFTVSEGVLLVGAPGDFDPDSNLVLASKGGVLVFEENANGTFQQKGHYLLPGAGQSVTQFGATAFIYSEYYDQFNPLQNPCDSADGWGLYLPCYTVPLDSLLDGGPGYDTLQVTGELHVDSCTFFIGGPFTTDGVRMAAAARGASTNHPGTDFGEHRTQLYTWTMDGALQQEGAIRASPNGINFDGWVGGFNSSLALYEDRLVKGGTDSLSGVGNINFYEFHADTTDRWFWSQQVVQSDPEVDDYFGWSVSLADGTIAAGSPLYGPNDDGRIYVFTDPALSMEELPELPFSISPVPASDLITVRSRAQASGDHLVEIVDMLGCIRGRARMREAPMVLDVSRYENGAYLLRAVPVNDAGPASSLRFIVVH